MTKKMEKKYIPLAEFFQNTLHDEVTLTYDALENIMGQQLPNAAHLNISWWTKTKPPLNHYLAWTQSDFNVVKVKLGNFITFARENSQYNDPQKKGNHFNLIARPLDTLDVRPLINLQTEIYNHCTYEYYSQNEYNMSVQAVKKQMAEWKKFNNSTILVGLIDGEYVSYADISGYQTPRQKHIATIRLGVLPNYQNKGLSATLLEKCFIWAKSHNITRLEAQIVEQHTAAKKLFEKYEFKIDGIREQSIQTSEGIFNEIYYSKLLV